MPDDILVAKQAQELRDGWQVRALIATRRRPIGMVVLSMLAHTYDDAMPVLLRVAFPGFTSIAPPFLTTCARIDKTGAVFLCKASGSPGTWVKFTTTSA